ncbi:hypothetical protein R3Q59_39520 [Rhodococcus jostii]|uniref:VOC domain-containing protein n=1 Tax=Rhodococcus jostii TaxID=132919 RepID=A0ABU4CSL5_RHOJO|nr:VOC family protein [Rhodococcus jostii]MDV6286573.1 hypothetical protein [Rhodococcus jostii]
MIELVQYEVPAGGKQQTENCNAGAMHLAFAVDGIHEIYDRLRALGATFLSPPALITPASIAVATLVIFAIPMV